MKGCIGCLVDGLGHTCGYDRMSWSQHLWKYAFRDAVAIAQTTGRKQRVKSVHNGWSWYWITEDV